MGTNPNPFVINPTQPKVNGYGYKPIKLYPYPYIWISYPTQLGWIVKYPWVWAKLPS
ncbi:unnamed protein product, partial [Linum tenue]